jgi:phage shock protein PspC (stress-responsive transcriptional regulator)
MQDEKNIQDGSDENLFNKMDDGSNPKIPVKKLQRSKNNVIIAGVCSGVAGYLNTDPANIRVIALLTFLLGGWFLAAYIVLAFLLPADNNAEQPAPEFKQKIKKENFRTLLGGLLILAGFHFAMKMFGINSGLKIILFAKQFVWALAIILLGLFLISKQKIFTEYNKNILPQKFSKSRNDKLLFGVCGGLAQYLGIDSFVIRIVLILSALLTLGMFLLIYLLFAIAAQFEKDESFGIK